MKKLNHATRQIACLFPKLKTADIDQRIRQYRKNSPGVDKKCAGAPKLGQEQKNLSTPLLPIGGLHRRFLFLFVILKRRQTN
ncbi:MAG: hypothetical protein QM296_04270 [Bacillota bacterium]|nr:hypothetical protein [Bacillota bacterium]